MDRTSGAYLEAKIRIKAKDDYNDLGFLEEEDIRDKILLNRFTKEETKAAIKYCLKEDVIDMYYKVQCPECGEIEHEREHEYPETPTIERLFDEGVLCDNCDHLSEYDDSKIGKVYCISHNILK